MWQAVAVTIVVFSVFGLLALCICEETAKLRRSARIEEPPAFEEAPRR